MMKTCMLILAGWTAPLFLGGFAQADRGREDSPLNVAKPLNVSPRLSLGLEGEQDHERRVRLIAQLMEELPVIEGRPRKTAKSGLLQPRSGQHDLWSCIAVYPESRWDFVPVVEILRNQFPPPASLLNADLRSIADDGPARENFLPYWYVESIFVQFDPVRVIPEMDYEGITTLPGAVELILNAMNYSAPR